MTLSIILAFEYIYWDEKTIWKFLQGWRVQVMYEEWTDGTLALNCPCWYIFNMERDVADFFWKILKLICNSRTAVPGIRSFGCIECWSQ